MTDWRKIVPNLFTLGAMVAAVLSILHAVDGRPVAAAQLIMLALAFDGLDGNVARWCRGSTTFGAELDTFVDIVAYGVAPAVLSYELVMKDHGAWGVAFVCLTVMSGALRLARFRVVDPFRGQHGYLGLPITVNAGWVAMFAIMDGAGTLGGGALNLAAGPLAAIVWSCSAVFLFLQVSNVHYGKPTKAPVFFAAGLIMILMLFLKQEVMAAAAAAIACYAIYYGFITPFMPRHVEAIEAAAEDQPEPAAERNSSEEDR